MNLKYPKGEIVWVQYIGDSEPAFILTSKTMRDLYYLYQRDGDGFKKLGKSRNPKELEEKFKVFKKIGV